MPRFARIKDKIMNRRGFLKSIGKVFGGILVLPRVVKAKANEDVPDMKLIEHHDIYASKCILGDFIPVVVETVVKQAIKHQNIKHAKLTFFVVCSKNVYDHLICSSKFIYGAKVIRSANLPPNQFKLVGVKR